MKQAVRDCLTLLFAALVPLAMAWFGFVGLSGSLLTTVYGVGKFVQFPFPYIYVWFFERDRLRTISFGTRGALTGIAFGLLVNVAMGALYVFALRDHPLLAETPASIFRKLEEFGMQTRGGYVAIGLFVCLLHSFLEEYYWRWFVFGWLRRYTPLRWAIGISSVAFMAHHVVILYVYFPGRFWILAAPLSLGVAVGGAVWAWLYDRSESLLGPWLSHALVDAGILLIGCDMLREMW